MKEQYIKFIDENVDGNGTNIENIAKVYGNDITLGTLNRIRNAITKYKKENENEWDTDTCLEVAQKQLEKEKYKVYWINENAEIHF